MSDSMEIGMNLEQIALKIAKEIGFAQFGPCYVVTHTDEMIEFARRLVAELGAQEPVIWIAGSYRKYLDGTVTDHLPMGVAASLVNWNWKDQIPLYAAPPICPTAKWPNRENEIAGVLRYCAAVQSSGTATERAVAQTVSRMLSATPEYKKP